MFWYGVNLMSRRGVCYIFATYEHSPNGDYYNHIYYVDSFNHVF